MSAKLQAAANIDENNENSIAINSRQVFFGRILREHSRIMSPMADRKHQPQSKRYAKFPSNSVTSARYTMWTFLPLQLHYQFSKLANFYFVFVTALQLVPGWSPTGRFTTLAPLSIFVGLAMLREAYDDRKRHAQDSAENNSKALLLRRRITSSVDQIEIEIQDSSPIIGHDNHTRGQTIVDYYQIAPPNASLDLFYDASSKWEDLGVGDIVRIEKGQDIPADILVLSSSHLDGACYVETSDLDGESALKQKQCLEATLHLQSTKDLLGFSGSVHAEAPNNDLYTFNAFLECMTQDHLLKRYPVTINQLLLRGSTLKNTDYIYGVVVFTGEHTKLRQNATSRAKVKSPAIQRTINKFVVAILIFILLISAACLGFYHDFRSRNIERLWYVYHTNGHNPLNIAIFASFFILFNAMMPISLYVTLEMAKLVQAYLIGCDLEMFDPVTGFSAKSRTSSLNEDLGQITYLFSDKTGTLTENIMKFRKYSAGGRMYDCLEMDKQDLKFGEDADRFMTAMALCHSVIPTNLRHISDEQDLFDQLTYQSSSPDEVAILDAAKEYGYIFHKRTPAAVHLAIRTSIQNLDVLYEVLTCIEFSSRRKRMTTIYRDPSGLIRLICKGADSTITQLLADPKTLNIAESHITEFANEGLRVLMYAGKVIPEDEFTKWSVRYEKACAEIENRDQRMDQVADEIESGLEYIGVSAVEDKLQEGVEETLDKLRQANIKLWVLTGDKRETAINVGYASNLLRSNSTLLVLDWQDSGGEKQLTAMMDRNWHEQREYLTNARHFPDRRHFVVVIDGETLLKLQNQHTVTLDLKDKDVETDIRLLDRMESMLTMFVHLGVLCDSVICCRVSPLQKAIIVKAMKQVLGKKHVTLAIGDGANDIAMIKEAHVGIGITGRESLQAARASDYSIARFRFLQRLLLVHGRWSYIRVSKLFFASIYKCVMFYMTQLVFQAFNGTSGTSLYEVWTLAGYNVFFSSLSVLFVGIFEADLTANTLLNVPELYRFGQDNEMFKVSTVLHWVIVCIYQAIVITIVPLSMFGALSLDGTLEDISSGINSSGSLYIMGTIVYTVVVIVVNIKVALLECHNIAWPTGLFSVLTIVFWFVFQGIYSIMWRHPHNLGYDSHGLAAILFAMPSYILIVVLTCVVALAPDVVVHVVQRSLYPSSVDVYQEKEKFTDFDVELLEIHRS